MNAPTGPGPGGPDEPLCGHGADPAGDPDGCPGSPIPGGSGCLAHVPDADRDAYLAGLAPGADIDHQATEFTPELLALLLDALRDPGTAQPVLGTARFDGARLAHANFAGARFSGPAGFEDAEFAGKGTFDAAEFDGPATFAHARFSGPASFSGAHFARDAVFIDVRVSGFAAFADTAFAGAAEFSLSRFSGPAGFDRARFSAEAHFMLASFGLRATFEGARFGGPARFGQATFEHEANFKEAEFARGTVFEGTWFRRDAPFDGARFSQNPHLGPLVCEQRVDLSAAVFEDPVTLEIAARSVRCVRTRWESTATVRLRHATVNLGQAVLAAPVAVTAHPGLFLTSEGVVTEHGLKEPSTVRMASLQGVDASLLVLTDTDLSGCLFSGAFHLDQIRLEGRSTFATAPTGWRRRGIRLTRWTRRRILAEEHHWRARTDRASGAWASAPFHLPAHTPGPEDVVVLYRQLRKALEDGKDEPGAADFYYGECEMRRHDRIGTPAVERRLLWAYWLLSGYGLRASRALSWLLACMTVTVVLLMGFGLPTQSPKQEATGTVPPGGGTVTFEIDAQDPRNPTGDRFTGPRFEKALNVTLNSVVFRSSGQDLTTSGTYIEMTSRLLEPALLAVAVLAVRGRIKR
ncbi:pentapeptide repeat-containing protein [Streptomyces sp. NPDC056716]|uniref:pentapeptide repeat-containing protein n=1 Tax=unclassified Streptomyces TaxID=2593676 RepID=UPI0036B0C441